MAKTNATPFLTDVKTLRERARKSPLSLKTAPSASVVVAPFAPQMKA